MDVFQKLSNALTVLVAFYVRKLGHGVLKCFCLAFIVCRYYYWTVTVSCQISAYLSIIQDSCRLVCIALVTVRYEEMPYTYSEVTVTIKTL